MLEKMLEKIPGTEWKETQMFTHEIFKTKYKKQDKKWRAKQQN
jgi:hypothetical protein